MLPPRRHVDCDDVDILARQREANELAAIFNSLNVQNSFHRSPPRSLPSNGKAIQRRVNQAYSFRSIPVVPRREELLPSMDSFRRHDPVPKNVIDGPFSTFDHYLDTQFRLTRENFVRPLKDVIEALIASKRKGKKPLPGASSYGLLCEDAVVDNMWFSRSNRMGFLLKFDIRKIDKANWTTMSKSMLMGSLLVMTNDGFRSIHLATVLDSNPAMLLKGMVLIRMEVQEGDERAWDLKRMQRHVWTVLESPGFFPAARYVLENLQTMDLRRLSIARCLVWFDGGDSMPNYLKILMAAKGALVIPGLSPAERFVVKFDWRMNAIWPHPSQLGFDEAQMEAFKAGLTREVALIQGPPGTGKTFLGLKLIQTLLMNRSWGHDSPILVVCYTNHALDQFLEGMLKFTNRIVRVGCQGQNEKLADYHIAEWLKNKGDDEERGSGRSRDRNHRAKTEAADLKRQKESLLMAIRRDLVMQSILLSGAGVLQGALIFERAGVKGHRFAQDRCYHGQSSFSLVRWLGLNSRTGIPNRVMRRVFDAEMRELQKEYGPGIRSELHRAVFVDADAAAGGHLWMTRGTTAAENYRDSDEEAAAEGLRMVEDRFEKDDGDIFLYRDEFSATAKMLEKLEERLFEASITKSNCLIQEAKKRMKQLKAGGERAYNKMQTAWKADKGPKMMAADEAERQAKSLQHDIEAEKRRIAEEQEKVDQLRAAIPLLRVPKSIQLSIPACGIPDSVAGMLDLCLEDRWLVYRFLVSQILAVSQSNLSADLPMYENNLVPEVEKYRSAEAVEMLKTMDVVGMTTTAAARDMARLKSLGPKIVIVEEAAEVFEASIITSLTEACEHLILIGDHKQLQPQPEVYELAVKHHMNVSMFERLFRNGFPHVTLRKQHRMRPEIADLIRTHIYPDLTDDVSVKAYEHVPGVCKDVFFVKHSSKEKRSRLSMQKSPENMAEVHFMLALCQYLIQQGVAPEQIAILTPYMAQTRRFFQTRSSYPLTVGVRIATVDAFQGEETDIVLLSLVRCNDNNQVGFLGIANRVNVALSRAKKGLYMMGDLDAYAEQSEIWRLVADKLYRQRAVGEALPLKCDVHNVVSSASCAEDFPASGGCDKVCGEILLACAHPCSRICHRYDRDHKTEETACEQAVTRVCSRFRHQKQFKCSEIPDCQCMALDGGFLPCGHHNDSVPCFCLQQGTTLSTIAMEGPLCTAPCNFIHQCGHICQLPCGHILRDADQNEGPSFNVGTFSSLTQKTHGKFCHYCVMDEKQTAEEKERVSFLFSSTHKRHQPN